MQRSNASSMMPLIPGMLSTHHSEMNRPDFRKRQILEQMSVGKTLSSPQDIAVNSASAKVNQVRLSNQVPDVPRSARGSATAVDRASAASTKYRVDATQPKWITNDRQVLRFYGYFQEKALENGRETLRTRRVVLCFYLSDSALSISEPRVANSGMAQGEFMKRTVASKPNGAKFSPEDFTVGGNVRLYGRVFHLVDCDEATRTFYDEALGAPLASPRKYPDDLSSHVDEIEAIKLRLRARTASAAESKAEATRKFHENGQKVLRFFVSWHDPHPLYPETRKYVLHYYLCDDTIEVIEPREGGQRGQQQLHHQQQQQQQMGGGGHHFAVLISRRRVVRDDSNQVQTLLAERPTGKALLTDRDLRCGEWVTILSRKFLLEDCDPFTREYYLTTHGVTQESCELQASAADVKPSKWKLFQAKAHVNSRSLAETGLGQPGISPALLQRLQSHVQDNQELSISNKRTTMSNSYPTLVVPTTADNSLDRKQLRFRAKFHSLSKSDLNFGREFTLTYFLEDDTLCVFEPRVKNSGVAGGRFLDRGRFRKCLDRHGAGDTTSRESQKERSAYCASDFYVGAIVRFEFSPNQRLELVEADQQTLSYCESHPELFPYSNSKLVIEILAKALLGSKSSADLLRRECRSVDKTGKRVLTLDEFRRVLDRFRLVELLNGQQLLTLARKFASEQPQDTSGSEPLGISSDEFCDAIAALTLGMTPSASQPTKDPWLRKLMKVPNLRNLLRRSDATSSQTVPGDAFLRIASFYHVGLSASDLEALMAKFSRNGAVEYHKLCDAVFQTLTSSQSSTEFSRRQQTSSSRQQHQQDEADDEFNFDGDELAQHCEPPGSVDFSPRRATPAVPKLHLQSSREQQQQHQNSSMTVTAARQPGAITTSDARVVAILRRVFRSRKYQLRKALRERDVDKTGQLGEEEFMEAVLSVEPSLSDDDTYAIADAYFPTNNCQLDYSQLLESAFRN
ncbi:hypothetical protein Gpo141_00007854 [Globisporangium polare]